MPRPQQSAPTVGSKVEPTVDPKVDPKDMEFAKSLTDALKSNGSDEAFKKALVSAYQKLEQTYPDPKVREESLGKTLGSMVELGQLAKEQAEAYKKALKESQNAQQFSEMLAKQRDELAKANINGQGQDVRSEAGIKLMMKFLLPIICAFTKQSPGQLARDLGFDDIANDLDRKGRMAHSNGHVHRQETQRPSQTTTQAVPSVKDDPSNQMEEQALRRQRDDLGLSAMSINDFKKLKQEQEAWEQAQAAGLAVQRQSPFMQAQIQAIAGGQKPNGPTVEELAGLGVGAPSASINSGSTGVVQSPPATLVSASGGVDRASPVVTLEEYDQGLAEVATPRRQATTVSSGGAFTTTGPSTGPLHFSFDGGALSGAFGKTANPDPDSVRLVNAFGLDGNALGVVAGLGQNRPDAVNNDRFAMKA